MINPALQLTLIALATISGFHESSAILVDLKPNTNFSLPCEARWAPACAACEDTDLTFANYCFYYKHRATENDSCRFSHFGLCETNCHRKKCPTKKDPICARCGVQDLSFRNPCELDNFNCLYKNTCTKQMKGYCKDRRGRIIHQKFFEKSQIHNDMVTETSVFSK